MKLTIPTLPALLMARLSRARAAIPPPEPDATPTRISVALSPTTRAALEAQAEALGTSMAALMGLILEAVTENTGNELAANTAFRRIAERLIWLASEHGLSMPATADHLARFGITKHALRDLDVLEAQLDSLLISNLARFFRVDRDWLVGRSSYLAIARRHWFKSAGVTAAALIAERRDSDARSMRLYLVKREGSTFDHRLDDTDEHRASQQFIPMIARLYGHPDETLTTLELLNPGRWNYSYERTDIKILIHLLETHHFDTSAFVLPDAEFDQLLQGTDLAVKLLASKHPAFNPDRYIDPRLANALEMEDWYAIRASDHFDRQVRQCAEVLNPEPATA